MLNTGSIKNFIILLGQAIKSRFYYEKVVFNPHYFGRNLPGGIPAFTTKRKDQFKAVIEYHGFAQDAKSRKGCGK